MARAVFIFDVRELMFIVQDRLRELPGQPVDDNDYFKSLFEKWIVRVIQRVCAFPTENPDLVKHLDMEVQEVLYRIETDYTSLVFRSVRVPCFFKSHMARVAIYRDSLWLVYDY